VPTDAANANYCRPGVEGRHLVLLPTTLATQLRSSCRLQPLTHKLLLLPHVSRRANALRGLINSLLVDG
jgi:hypothetical protein